jgi:hypothetical protein
MEVSDLGKVYIPITDNKIITNTLPIHNIKFAYFKINEISRQYIFDLIYDDNEINITEQEFINALTFGYFYNPYFDLPGAHSKNPPKRVAGFAIGNYNYLLMINDIAHSKYPVHMKRLQYWDRCINNRDCFNLDL